MTEATQYVEASSNRRGRVVPLASEDVVHVPTQDIRITVGDLPEELRAQLRGGRRLGTSLMLIEVLDETVPMSLNQILVAVWNKYHVVITRETAASVMAYSAKRGKVRRCGKGSYVKVKAAFEIDGGCDAQAAI